jgi:hypothetical protein
MEARPTKNNRIHLEFSTLLFDDDFDFSVTTVNKSGANLGLSLTLDGAIELKNKLSEVIEKEVAKLNKVV